MEWEEGFQARGQSSGMTSPHQQRIHLCSQLTTIPHRARSSLLLVLSTRISVHDNDIPPTTYTSISCYICITVTPRWVVISVSLSQQRYHCYTSMSCYICIIVTTVVSLLHLDELLYLYHCHNSGITVTPRWVVISVSLSQQRYHCYTSISCYICIIVTTAVSLWHLDELLYLYHCHNSGITVTPRWVVISVSLSQQRYHCYTSMSCYICIIVTTVVSLLHSKVSKVNVDLYSA